MCCAIYVSLLYLLSGYLLLMITIMLTNKSNKRVKVQKREVKQRDLLGIQAKQPHRTGHSPLAVAGTVKKNPQTSKR